MVWSSINKFWNTSIVSLIHSKVDITFGSPFFNPHIFPVVLIHNPYASGIAILDYFVSDVNNIHLVIGGHSSNMLKDKCANNDIKLHIIGNLIVVGDDIS